MSLNCLTCQVLQRTNSDCERHYRAKKHSYKKLFCPEVHQRSWSGNLRPPPPNHGETTSRSSMAVAEKAAQKLGHRRLHGAGTLAFEGTAEPRLVRSCGMRRDWSFENLSEIREEKKWRICY